ncbi:hypothetical protein OPQ81_001020 [Rhizoctonia solani]|nr:hypothetical protein OPQ81_001020 [Rhizoctonia solani]
MYSNTVRVGGLYIDGQEKFGPSSEPTVVPLCLPKDHLNNVLLGITTLQLRLIYFPWTSPVYHGLLELRLTGYQDCISITRLQLANMLGASPQLRILEFGLHIEKESPLNTPAVPIHLMHLEALDLTMCLRVDVEFLLQWLAPGSRPLQLSLPCCHPMSAIGELASSMEPFLSRSNMATLHVMKYDFACASALIDASPKLQTLVVERVQRGLPVNKYQARAGPRELKSLYLLDSFVILEDLVKFLELWPTQTLVLWRTKFDSDSYPGGRVSSDAVLQELSRVCGDVQWVSESAPNPTKI